MLWSYRYDTSQSKVHDEIAGLLYRLRNLNNREKSILGQGSKSCFSSSYQSFQKDLFKKGHSQKRCKRV